MIDVVIDKLSIPNFLPTGDVKFIARFSDEKNNMLLEIVAFVYLKTGSLQQIHWNVYFLMRKKWKN
jgi:hypothetical protein